MKKLINITIIFIFVGALAIANNKINKLENKLIENNNIISTSIEKIENKDFKIIDTYVTGADNTIIEFNDYSYAVINHNKNIYKFIPSELGDWDVKTDNKEDLIKVIKSYMMYKYNMNFYFESYLILLYLFLMKIII